MSTIRDIARAAGVSVSTASLALNGDTRVRPATRERVLVAAAELKYHPSRTAKSLSSGRTWSLHLMNPMRDAGLSSSFFTKFVRGVHDVVVAHDFTLALTVLDDEREASDLLKKLTLERWTDGVILMNVSEEDSLIGQLVKLEFPHVLLGHSSLPGVTSVDSDNFAVAFDATNHLIEKGHTPIAFLNGSARHAFVQERTRGFLAAHAATALAAPGQGMVYEAASADKAREVTTELIRAGLPLGGILATSDEAAIGALRALRDAGIHVPDEVAVVGINNDDLTEFTDPRLTSVELNAAELGRVAAELLISSIARHPPERRLVPHRLVSRDSS